jgi:hypothetical protein
MFAVAHLMAQPSRRYLSPSTEEMETQRLQLPHNGRREPFLSCAGLGGRCGLPKAEDSAVMDKQIIL